MSSQTMAATMVGRRDHEPADRSMLDFSDNLNAADFPDVPAGTAPAFQTSPTIPSDLGQRTAVPAGTQDQDDNERNAISNLLAQLARGSNAQRDVSSANSTDASNSKENATQPPTATQPSLPPSQQDILQMARLLAKDTVMDQTFTQHPALQVDAPIAPHIPAPHDYQTWDAVNTATHSVFDTTVPQQEVAFETPFPAIPPPIIADALHKHQSFSPLDQDLARDEELPEKIDQSATRGQVEAYAKLEFPDGVYYITTHSCELGRDVRMYISAKRKKATSLQNSHGAKSGASSDKASRLSKRSRKEGGSLVKRSVVSDKGGFCGMDDSGPEEDVQQERKESDKKTHSSQPSETSVVKPQDLELNVPLPPFDYQHYALELAAEDAMFEDDERPAPVTSEHLPQPKNSNPLVPIHHMVADTVEEDLKNHTSISRRHIRICWDYKHDCWKAHVMGRNGAFIDGKYVPKGSVGTLQHGSKIQIAAMEATFKLPQTMVESTTDESEADEDVSPSMNRQSATPPSEEGVMSMSPSRTAGARTKINLKLGKKPSMPQPVVPLDVDGQPVPPKKRGPGRPPKDGIMSNREKRERARAQKAAEAKEANGGVTPPPTGRVKFNRPFPKPEVADPAKPEKRKYTKRKRAETDDILPSIEGEDGDPAAGTDEDGRAARKARPSRSRSPDYPPKESWTEEQLAKPPDNYARLIYDILNDVRPKELGLRQIYRELKKKWPYFVHGVQTEGWQSSVRHNLNSEHEKLFEKGQKDGKGWAWRAIEGAMEPKEEIEKKKRAVAAAAAAKANASSMPNGPRYPPQGPPRPGQQWQQPPGQMFMYPGMPPSGPGQLPPRFYPPPMPPHNGPWPPPFHQGPPPPPNQTQILSTANGSGAPPPFPPHQPGPAWPHPPNMHGPPNMAQGFGPPMHPPPSSHNVHNQNADSSAPPNVGPPPTPGTISAGAEDLTNPCSSQGMAILGRFIGEFVSDWSEKDKVRAREVFEDAKRVVLRGAPEPVFTSESDKGMFGVMIDFARNIVKTYPNPGYLRPSVETGGGQKQVQAKDTDSAKSGDGMGKEDVKTKVTKEAEQDHDAEMRETESFGKEAMEGSQAKVDKAPNSEELSSKTSSPEK